MHACEVMKNYIIANIFSHAIFQTTAYGRCLSVLANISYLMLILMSVSGPAKGSRSFHILSVSVSFCCSNKQPWNLSGFLLPRVCFLFTGLLEGVWPWFCQIPGFCWAEVQAVGRMSFRSAPSTHPSFWDWGWRSSTSGVCSSHGGH